MRTERSRLPCLRPPAAAWWVVQAAAQLGRWCRGLSGSKVAGLVAGGSLGAAVGVVPAVITFGVSIPLGAAVGSMVGLVSGAAAGGTAGMLGGGLMGRSYVRIPGPRCFFFKWAQALCLLQSSSLTVKPCLCWWSFASCSRGRLPSSPSGPALKGSKRF